MNSFATRYSLSTSGVCTISGAKIHSADSFTYGNFTWKSRPTENISTFERGHKQYELSDHLGNVQATISDRNYAVEGPVHSISHYQPVLLSRTEVYPFGWGMPGRSYNGGEYRYGFNTQEKVDEVKGTGNQYTAEFWEYDPRAVHRWNTDPVVKYHESPYAVMAGNPIWFVDPNGADTLQINRSTKLTAEERDAKFGELEGIDGWADLDIYEVSFSYVRDGEETVLEEKMYMVGNPTYSKKGDNALNKEYYTLMFDKMSTGEHRDNDIRVGSFDFGVFIHPGTNVHDFRGCYGLTCKDPIVENGYLTIIESGNAQQVVRDLYNVFSEHLMGEKFILRTNYKPQEAPVNINPKKIDLDILR